ncbi:Zinc-type alcohol dehydrogenase-like protein [Cyphellophora attinorum]|uniref:Zinc-type alcohol dehydrogenase-like protein n=1 Tax=Cyphellophora attinorum TaxID=1664694 RepID=A0A0N1HY23_9EURO|nr:Zinc-type alcohol dehydrogenase-like protein [Phialophora attinorum]KPI45643.1 Zinc-type alcohol dehydrogenase-like protein [Phialophora attinorum]
MADSTKVPAPVYTTEYKPHPTEKMKAAQWTGTKSVKINEVPKPTITAPKDAIVRITHCCICGSDLHMYGGEMNMAMQPGDILGHEAIGYIEEVGPEVQNFKAGDRAIILPVIACGECFYCQNQQYSLCDTTNPSKAMSDLYGHRLSGIFGYSHLTGGYSGNQAEFCRVPNADIVLLHCPEDMPAKKALALADVTDTAWHGVELAEVRGAKKVYAVDKDPQRLKIAESHGMIPVDASKVKPDEYILSVEPRGLDRGIEASGFRATNSVTHKLMRATGLEGDSTDTISEVIKATRKGGNVALIGDFFFHTNMFPIGMLMEKTITLRGGQLMAQKYYPYLLDLVKEGKYDPSFVFTNVDDFENIPQEFDMQFHQKVPGGLKSIMVTPYGRELNQPL